MPSTPLNSLKNWVLANLNWVLWQKTEFLRWKLSFFGIFNCVFWQELSFLVIFCNWVSKNLELSFSILYKKQACTLRWVKCKKFFRPPPKINFLCMRNHPNKFQAKIQSLGSSVFGSKFSGQNGVLVGLEFSDKFTFQSIFHPLEWFYAFKP